MLVWTPGSGSWAAGLDRSGLDGRAEDLAHRAHVRVGLDRLLGRLLSLVGGLPNLLQAGSFTVGSLPGISRSVAIGSRSARGTSIGAVSIQSTPRTKQQKGTYDFAFSTWAGQPNAVVAGRGANATRNGAAVGGVKLFLTAGGSSPTGGQVKKKKSQA